MTVAESAEVRAAESIIVDGAATDIGQLSWWRRPRRLRRQLVGTLVLVAFASIALIGSLNYFAARNLLDTGTKEQLASVGQERARAVENGLGRLTGSASAMAADLAIVEALEDFTEATAELEGTMLDADQKAELDDAYDQFIVGPLNELDVEPVSLDDVRPTSDVAQYLQYNYVLPEVDNPDAREDIVDAGDGSDYSAVHAANHEYLRSVADAFGLGDLLLVSSEGDVVYSTEKRIDFGTSLASGPYDDSELATTVLERLPRVRIGESVIADQELYLPGGAKPAAFVAAGVRRGSEVIGALVMQIPVEAFNSIATANGQYEAVGLGAKGDSYMVGGDLLLTSESRLWIDDPDAYLDRVKDDELSGLIAALGSPVGLQPVDTKPVRAAIDGDEFEGTAKSYLGQSTYAYAAPIDAAGVDWIIVAEVPLGQARSPLRDYAKRLGLVILIVLPLAALLGFFMAGRITRPIPPVVGAAFAVAEGDRDPQVPDFGNDEFGDLGRRLKVMAHRLGAQEAELEAEYERTRELLLTVLPPRIVRDDGAVVGSGEAADEATVVAVSIDVVGGDLTADDEAVAELLRRSMDAAESTAAERGMERIRASADRSLFLAGVSSPSDGADDAIEFASELSATVEALADDQDVDLALHIGLSTGPVATGVLEQGRITFATWGEPVRRALAVGAFSNADEILVDASTAAAASSDRWSLQQAHDVIDLDGQPMNLFTLEPRAD